MSDIKDKTFKESLNESFTELPEDVRGSILELQMKYDQKTINEITSRNAKQIEDDVFNLSGNVKPSGMRYYEYLKEEFNKVKATSGSVEELTAAKQTIATLEDQVKNGLSDEAAKQQIIDYKARVNQLETDLQTEKATYSTKLVDFQKDITKSNILSFTKGKKPANGMDQKIFDEIAETRVNNLMSGLTPEITRGDDGRELKQFRDKDNNVLLNPDNGHRPFTETELATKYLGDIIETKREAAGAGLNGDGKGKTVSIISAKSQTEFDELVHQQLTADGISKQNPEYYKKVAELREANNVKDLPLV